jgi:hypothetical protein
VEVADMTSIGELAVFWQIRKLKAQVDTMTTEERYRIHECMEKLDDLVDEYGKPGLIALKMVAVEKQIEPEDRDGGRYPDR